MATKQKESATMVMGGIVRFGFVHVFTPAAMEGDEDGKKKYSVQILIPKSNKTLVKQIKTAIEAAKEAGKAKWGGKIPASLKLPLRDGDAEKVDDENYAGMYFMSASSKGKPGVVDKNREPITEEDDEFYSGVWGRFHVNFYPFNSNGNKGVACGLNHLQKIKDGERLAGRIVVEDAFDEYEGADDDEDDDMLG